MNYLRRLNMNRWQDLKLRLVTLMIPIGYPILILECLYKDIRLSSKLGYDHTIKYELYDYFMLVKADLRFSQVRIYLESVYNACFDWEIGSCNKPQDKENELILSELNQCKYPRE